MCVWGGGYRGIEGYNSYDCTVIVFNSNHEKFAFEYTRIKNEQVTH